MAEEKKPAEAAPAQKGPLPEEEAASRIRVLQEEIGKLEKECKTLDGRIANLEPGALEQLGEENGTLELRRMALEKALFALLSDAFRPRFNDAVKLQYESLRQAAVEFCQKANIDPEIWKNIAS